MKKIIPYLTNIHTWIITGLFVLGIFFHYPQQLLGTESTSLFSFMGLTHPAVERMFFLIPITYSGMYFGLRYGILSLAASLAVILPYIFINPEHRVEAVLETGAMVLLGMVVNLWFEVNRRESKRYRGLVQQLEESDRRMRDSEQKYHYLFDHASDAIWVQDVNGQLIDGNHAFEEMTGYPLEEARGINIRYFLSPESLALAREIREKLIAGEPFEQPYEQQFYVRDGSVKTVNMSTNPVIAGGRITGFEHVARDVTREKQQEANVRSYIHQITMAQEEERKRVARDLHDDVSPEILVLINKLDALAAERRSSPAQRMESLEAIREQAVRALDRLRSTAQGLRPRILDDLGLVAAVEWLAEALEKEGGIELRVESDGMDREPSSEIQIVLFRIAQEALNNIRKHSRASRVDISITGSGIGITMIITDNGTGFVVPDHVEDNVSEGQLGLMGMDERADLVGGRLDISSSPFRGTRLTVTLPWKVAGLDT